MDDESIPTIQITATDLTEAESQIAAIELALTYTVDPAARADLQTALKQIQDEAREYDYALNPRAKPFLCRVCNGHPYVLVPQKPCAECGLMLTDCRPPDGKAHWIVPDEAVANMVLEIGINPDEVEA